MSEIISLKNISVSFESIESLPDDVVKITEDLESEDLELNDLKNIICRIDDLEKKYPTLPDISDIRLAVYSMIIQFEEDDTLDEKFIDDMIAENYKKFPNFLSARCNYADLCLRNNKIDEFLKVFDNKFALEDLYPEKKVFHFNDALQFYSTIGHYYCLKNDLANAEKCIDILVEIDEEAPQTIYLYDYMMEYFEKEMTEKFELKDDEDDFDFDDEDEDVELCDEEDCEDCDDCDDYEDDEDCDESDCNKPLKDNKQSKKNH